ncbi:aldo/keto reductase [Muricauda sp. JGD-17]|uniref:Aldo/keto reductase n=1 Tax=Flagellimonas ochracea TaxID=2696472 RepID=A0A964TCK6_9FLAO|nr:aldo/keto reductase [Allomuricauda ochracea]NAY92397.1 aldo/keto reductase [Allomuricauda ochracea]
MKTIKSRREALELCGLGAASLFMPFSMMGIPFSNVMKLRKIPMSGEQIPVVGLGTWQTFDVGSSTEKRAILLEVLKKMHEKGGRVIDSSPMYGSSESVVGDLTEKTNYPNEFFYATKVWTQGKEAGLQQIKNSIGRIRQKQMDLIQIHNLVDYRTHIKSLRSLKDNETIRYWGITHYVDSAHDRLAAIIKSEHPDFVQFNYSIRSRNAERVLLETAQKYSTAVLINRPFEGGSLFRLTKNKPLPEWCEGFQIKSWGQYFLKYILSHEAVTCVIPGTSKPHHVIDNMMAGYGNMPDQKTREKMYSFIKN